MRAEILERDDSIGRKLGGLGPGKGGGVFFLCNVVFAGGCWFGMES